MHRDVLRVVRDDPRPQSVCPKIGDDPERAGADACVNGAEAVLVPCAVIVDSDDEVQPLFGIAEDVLDQSFVDAHLRQVAASSVIHGDVEGIIVAGLTASRV